MDFVGLASQPAPILLLTVNAKGNRKINSPFSISGSGCSAKLAKNSYSNIEYRLVYRTS